MKSSNILIRHCFLQVVIVDKSVFGIGEDAEINAPVVLFKMDILRGGVATPLYGYHFVSGALISYSNVYTYA